MPRRAPLQKAHKLLGAHVPIIADSGWRQNLQPPPAHFCINKVRKFDGDFELQNNSAKWSINMVRKCII